MCEHGTLRQVEIRGTPVGLDECIADLVMALNAAGYVTVASCCGHGHRPGVISLDDDRYLLVMPDYESLRQIDHLWPDIHGHPVQPAASDPCCWRCGLPKSEAGQNSICSRHGTPAAHSYAAPDASGHAHVLDKMGRSLWVQRQITVEEADALQYAVKLLRAGNRPCGESGPKNEPTNDENSGRCEPPSGVSQESPGAKSTGSGTGSPQIIDLGKALQGGDDA